MDKVDSLSPAVNPTRQRRPRTEPVPASPPPPLQLPNPFVTRQGSAGSQADPSSKSAGKGGPASRGRGYSSSRPVRDLSPRTRSTWDPQTKSSRSNNDPQSRITGRVAMDAQRKGFRGARSAPTSAGRPKPAQINSALFEVKLADFPELVGVPLIKAATPVTPRVGWGPHPPSTSRQTPQIVSSWKSGRRGSPTRLEAPQSESDVKPDVLCIRADQPVATSWANIASQPPKQAAAEDKTISKDFSQMEDVSVQQEEGAPGKKKRKKKKKAKGPTEDAEIQPEENPVPQEPPKFEDEEEFPGLTPALTGANRLLNYSSAKLCNEGNQREVGEHPFTEQNKEKSPAAKSQQAETAKKTQKAEKVSGKKSKVPVQLDIGNMLAALEKKQQSQKATQEVKPLILSVGGGLPVVQKQSPALKKPSWKQDKIAHNPLDSTSPLVKKGKQREVPKAKKPTPLKRVILKEREERKQRRLLEERALPPEDEERILSEATEEEQCDADAADELGDLPEECHAEEDLDNKNPIPDGADEEEMQPEETQPEETQPEETQVQEPEPAPAKIHSRKFRDYCSQMLSKDVDECVTTLLKELVRFQDRLYQKDPMKARMKRRIVMGLREVLKHLKLRKVKCVIISPNCERSQSKGGLDEALHAIIDTCREQDVPFVFALSRKALGRCVNKAVPVSLVGIFNYDGAQDFYHKMIELSSEARRAYEVMVSSVEQQGNTEELQIHPEEPHPDSHCNLPQEPDYIKVWKKMLEKDCSHGFLTLGEQLSSLHFNSECTANSEEEEEEGEGQEEEEKKS